MCQSYETVEVHFAKISGGRNYFRSNYATVVNDLVKSKFINYWLTTFSTSCYQLNYFSLKCFVVNYFNYQESTLATAVIFK